MAITSWVRILASAAVIVFAGAVTASATGAFFSSTQTSPNNIFTAGTLNLNLTGGDISTTTPFIVANMMPGELSPHTATFTVSNDAWFKVTVAGSPVTPGDPDASFNSNLSFVATLKDGSSVNVPLTAGGGGIFKVTSVLTPAGGPYTLTVTGCLGAVSAGPTCDGTAVPNTAQGGSSNVTVTLDASQEANQPNPF